MMHKFCLYLFLLVTFGIKPLLSKTVDETFEEGNQEYAKANKLLNEKDAGKAGEGFERAASLYLSCLEKAESAALHFNLGNTYFKLGKAGHSIYHFKQALLLDPTSEETRANLALARKSAKLPKEQGSLYAKTLARRSPHFWKWLLWAGIWIGVSLVFLPKYFGLGGPVPQVTGAVSLLFSIVPLWAIQKASLARNVGIILGPDTPMLVSPTLESASSHILQPGQEVFLRPSKQSDGYVFANTGNGESGWIKLANIGRLHP
jgi:tetratricopeptide (TPR) repeat protein